MALNTPSVSRLAVALAGGLLLLAGWPCRASVLHGKDLSNFQNEFACDNRSVLIVRPHTVLDIQRAVASHATVMASGAGHSWNQPFFCAGATAAGPAPAGRPGNGTAAPGSSVNIALTTLRPLAIEVNTSDSSVWVDAAVITADLLQYLANYVTEDAPAGWTLPAFPWFVFQTIGGAVATGSHGSSLAAGSLSSPQQLLGLEMVASADGSLRRYTPEQQPFLFRALRVSVGRLGVITRLKLRIEREVPVRRTLTVLAPSAFLAQMRELQAAARAAGPAALLTPGGTVAALPAWANDTEWFWVPQKHDFFQVSFSRADAPGQGPVTGFVPDSTTVFSRKGDILALGEDLHFPPAAVANLTAGAIAGAQPVVVVPPGGPLNFAAGAHLYARSAESLRSLVVGEINAPLPAAGPPRLADASQGQRWARPTPNGPSIFYAASNMAEGTNEISRIGIREVAGNATVESTAAYIKQPNATLAQLRRTLYDQYEVSMPLSVVADCMAAVLESAYGTDLDGADAANRTADKGFRTAPLIRLVGPEDGLLAHTHDGARLFLNLEDYLFYNAGRRPNARFRAIMAVLTGDRRCTAAGPIRLHWGKAGWPDAGCWRGDEQYGNNWCSFGCAARVLDPQGKFRDSAPDRWTWAGVDLERCCGPDGFDAQREGCACTVRHERPRERCPPPPFYTQR